MTASPDESSVRSGTIFASDPQWKPSEAVKDVLFGSIAGSVGKVIEYPFDTVKVRLQAQSLSAPRYAGPFDCFRQSIQAKGFFEGLYRGISAPLVGAAIETSSLFFSYRIAQDLLIKTIRNDSKSTERRDLGLESLVFCGAMSGAFTSILLTPIELVKCQMQVPFEEDRIQRKPLGPFSIITRTFRSHGIFGFWRGQLGTLIRETGGSAAWFGSYEGISALWRARNDARDQHTMSKPSHEPSHPLPIHQQLTAGAVAGMAYNFIFYPADTIKSRMQIDQGAINSNNRRPLQPSAATKSSSLPNSSHHDRQDVQNVKSARESFWRSGRSLWQQQGLRGMYRGCGITVARAAPSSAFIFAIYESLKSNFG